MALHISVKGQFGTSCRRSVNILDDPDRVRKDLENERRITRLQQVREKSSHLARKIREDVAAEKKRQLQRLQQTKQDELKVWREHVLVKKHQDYRSAIFQVGSAHRAAQEETERIEKRKQEKIDKIRQCRQRAMKRNAGKTKVKLRSTAGMNLNTQGRATTGTQTPLPEDKTQPQSQPQAEAENKENRTSGGATHNNASNPRHACCDEHPNCFCLSSDDDDCVDFECESSDSSILHLDDVGAEQNTPNPEATNKLKKNPPVILDVNIDDADCRVINTCTGLDINDRYIQLNRKFSHVVRPSPRTSPERRDSPRRPRFTQITDLVRRTETIVWPVEEPGRAEAPAPAPAPAPAEPQPVRTAPPSPTKSLPRSPRKTMPPAKAPPVAPSGSKLSTKRAPVAVQQPNKGSRAGTGTSKQLPTRRSTGLKTDPPPAKVIDAGIKRKTLTKKVTPQASAAQPKAQAAQQATTQGEVPPMQQAPLMQQQPMQQPSLMQQQTQMQQPLPMQQHPQMQPPNPLQQAPTQYRHPLHHQQQQQGAYAPLQQQQAQYPPPPLQQQQAQYPPPPLQHQQQAAYPPPHPYATYPQSQPPQPYPQHSMQNMQPYAMPFPGQPFPPPPPPHSVYAQQHQAMAMPMPRAPPPVIPAAAPQRSSSATSIRSSTDTFILRQSGQQSNPVSSVHFYDHNNKYHRTYEAPGRSVQLNGPDPRVPNAMAQAQDENHLRGLREQELEHLRKKCDKRGQRALEREQVRRDCAELTEKLEALSQQQPNLLPSDANFIAGHRYADLAARREHKMNEAMEEMLLRPAIVTCPEVGASTSAAKPGRSKVTAPNAINVGEHPDKGTAYKGSSDSCCSMLLDYVDDQSKQLRSDLRAAESNTSKSLRLKNLLDRVERIRTQLMEELKAGERPASHADKDKEVLDAIRQEREDILTEKARTLNERETELEQKEALLEQRLRKFYKEQKQKKSSDIEVNARNGDNPVIIIKVNSDGTVKQCKPKNKSNPKGRSTAIEGTKESTSVGIIEATSTEAPLTDLRQNSIDSNSTAYRSLPPITYKNPNAPPTATEGPPTPLDPIIAHYIQRLLGMTRRSMQELSVSSSEVPTPDPSIINVSANITREETVADKLRVEPPAETVADRQAAADKLREERVQAFIQDNRSFVDELDDTLRNQQQQQHDKESSMQAFDQIWNKRLANKVVPDKGRPTKQAPVNRRKERSRDRVPRPSSSSRSSPIRKSATIAPLSKRTTQSAIEKSDKNPPSQEPADLQIERYARLTENCTHRIAELTELITKVREEKQRLVEVTLTSASEGERLSTEYLELPPGQMQPQQGTQRQNRSRTISERSDNTTPSTSEALPLIKHKSTAASRDSGISESRPITALGLVNAEAEPPPSTQSTTQRRGKAPPATIRRYSPQLDAEDLAHELSTIAEVDTPGQSHIVGATPVPKPFPNFDEYARELHLDLSHLDADQSLKLQRDFDELVQAINQRCGGLNYREFPSIGAYLQNVSTTRLHVEETEHGTVTTGELMRQLRLDTVPIEHFPERREYLQKLLENVPADQREMIDSASLDNDSTDSFNVEKELRQRRIIKSTFRHTDGASEVITTQEVASSTRRESAPPNSTEPPNESGIDQLTGSSLSRELDREMQRIGVQWPIARRQRQADAANCSSSSSSSQDSHPRRLRGGQSLTSARKSTHTTSDQSAMDASQIGRSLNLREFLTRELLKHHVGLVDSSDDSLKSSFLHSIIDSLSRSSSPSLGHGTGATNDRQKTSTPRGSFLTTQEKSGGTCLQTPHETPRLMPSATNSQLFSGESRISLINYPDGTPPVPFGSQQQQQSDKASSSTDATLVSPRKSDTKRTLSARSPRK